MNRQAHLKKLRTQGFNPLRDTRIHYRCPSCGRKQSNACRMDYDPPKAFVAEFCCTRCCQGHKDCGIEFYDKRGQQVFEEEP